MPSNFSFFYFLREDKIVFLTQKLSLVNQRGRKKKKRGGKGEKKREEDLKSGQLGRNGPFSSNFVLDDFKSKDLSYLDKRVGILNLT